MEIELILSFCGASILLILMPGPDIIFVLTESLTKGQKNGIAVSIGLVLGVMTHTLAAATGLSIVIQQSAMAFQIVKYLGAGYLLYLAYKAAKERRIQVDLTKNNNNGGYNLWKLIRVAYFMNVLNPKVSLFFIAFLPQFLSKPGYHITLQMIILGFLFMVMAFLILLMISVLSSKFSNYLNSNRFWLTTKWGKIIVLSMLGLTLAVSKK